MNFKIHFALMCALCACILSGAGQEKDYSYTVGPGDLLRISVFNVPDLNTTVRVSSDGKINLALLGNIAVEGLTAFELEKKLVELLEQKYLRNPQVTIFIQEYQSKKVAVMGAVKSPGNYDLIGKRTLLELISMAGGLTDQAAENIVVIRKYKDGNSSSLKINRDKLMIQGDPQYNIPLQAGDIINVPNVETIDVYVLGQVRNPGRIQLRKGGDVTLLRAIAQAGGFTDRARKSGVKVTRMVDGKEKLLKVNVSKILRGSRTDFVLEHNDVIHVPESIL